MSFPPAHAEVLSPAKINLSLRIVGRRPDGYHLLDSIVLPVSLFDRVDVRFMPGGTRKVRVACHPPLPGPRRDNLAARAAELFLSRTGCRGTVQIDLAKEIPVGAGLGGGSSDAAGVLRALRALVAREIPAGQLIEWALELGADVPFFVFGRPARMEGIGERLAGLDRCPAWPLVIAYPGTGLPTADVYHAYDVSLTTRASGSKDSVFVLEDPPIRVSVVNDLEEAAFRLKPELVAVKARLLELGARGASMTGSGSAVFGVWDFREGAESAAIRMRDDGLWARAVEVLSQVPDVRIF